MKRFTLGFALLGLLFGAVQAYAIPTLSVGDLSSSTADVQPRYVTSDSAGSHFTTPGVPAFGVNPDGVCLIDAYVGSTPQWSGSGALLWDSGTILTAAHVLDGATSITATFETPSGDIVVSSPYLNVHPLWNGLVDYGYDVGVVNLTGLADPSVPGYGIYTGASGGEFGVQSVKMGYGMTGHGSTGATTYDGLKRAGLNMYDGQIAVLGGQWMNAYDFDSGFGRNNAWELWTGFPSDLGYGYDEVNSAPGDSGGPTFVYNAGTAQWEIAGVTSYGFGFTTDPPDMTPGVTDSSWGEISVDAWIWENSGWIEENMGVIPEPGSAVIFLGLLGPWMVARWWRRKRSV